MRIRWTAVAAWAGLAACGSDEVSVPAEGAGRYDEARIERERLDRGWRPWAERDRLRRSGHGGGGPAEGGRHPAAVPGGGAGPGGGGGTAREESFEAIGAMAVNDAPLLPVPRSGGGPSVLRVQVYLDRIEFSPGILDGYWGKNTEKAVYWFQEAEGLEPTGVVDSATYRRLAERADHAEPVMQYGVTRSDLAGPFVELPDDVYERAELRCQCYESALEKLAEKFHVTPEVLAQLNPGVDLEGMEEGTTLWVPNVEVRGRRVTNGKVAKIVVSRKGFYTHALDEDGAILFHFPSTLGSAYDPSPHGVLRVTGIAHDPHFRYQPKLFHEVPDHRPEALLEPGPNSPVGVVWIALSKPHYGIHGTSEPRTIGYTSSHGCVRLTNWDARTLARHTPRRTPVEFR